MAERKARGILTEARVSKNNITTIKLDNETKLRLDRLKEHKRESYSEIIKKILNIFNIFKNNPPLGNKILTNIDRSIRLRPLYMNTASDAGEEKRAMSS